MEVLLHVSVFETSPFTGKNSQARFSWAACRELRYVCIAARTGGCKQCYCVRGFVSTSSVSYLWSLSASESLSPCSSPRFHFSVSKE